MPNTPGGDPDPLAVAQQSDTQATTPLGTPSPDTTTDLVPPAPADAGDVPHVPGYEVHGEIARGGMGRVLAARDITLDREVAIKVLLPGRSSERMAGRFVTESKVTAQLSHPGIPPVHALGNLPDGGPFLAMKLIKGRTLADLLGARPNPAAELTRFVTVFEQIAQTVGYAHARGVIHRDLKPANVMVGEFAEVQVMDWGLAKDTLRAEAGAPHEVNGADVATPHTDRTEFGQVIGTPAYMAPEQARGEPVGPRADVFALGGILCVILTGKPPFGGANSFEVVKKAAAGELEATFARLDACGADPEVVALAKRCLAPVATDRPADGGAVAGAVAAYRTGVEERLRVAERQRVAAEAKAAEQRKRRKVQFALTVALGLLLVGGGAVAWWQRELAADAKLKQIQEDEQRKRDEERMARNAKEIEGLVAEGAQHLVAGEADRARGPVEQAEKRLDAGGAGEALRALVAQCRADLDLLRELDRVNDAWLTSTNETVGTARAFALHEEWAKVFQKVGIVPGKTTPEEVKNRVQSSLIRESLREGLDQWLMASVLQKNLPEVRALASAADPDPFRDEFRAAIQDLARFNTAPIVAVIKRPEMARQPPRFVAAACRVPLVPANDRGHILWNALADHPTNVSLLMFTGQHATPVGGAVPTPQSIVERVGCYRTVVALRPQYPLAWHLLGISLSDADDRNGAIAALKKASELDPTSSRVWCSLAVEYALSGDLDGSIAYGLKALALEPDFAFARQQLGWSLRDKAAALLQKGDRNGAFATYREWAKHEPKNPDPHDFLGLALFRAGKHDEAVASFNEAIRIEPNDANYRIHLAVTLNAKRDFAAAIAACEGALKIAPNDVVARYQKANAHRVRGEYDFAIADYSRVVQLAPDLKPARQQLAECCQEIVGRDPKSADAHRFAGEGLRALGDAKAAEAEFREALRLNSKDRNAHIDLGILLRDRKQLADSAAAFRDMTRQLPSDPWGHSNLGLLLRMQGDHAASIASYKEAIRIDGKVAVFHWELANVYRAARDAEAATASYRKAAELDPKAFGQILSELPLKPFLPLAPLPHEPGRAP